MMRLKSCKILYRDAWSIWRSLRGICIREGKRGSNGSIGAIWAYYRQKHKHTS